MQRQQIATELQTLVLGLGEEAQTSGSFGGVLRRGWMDLKAAITSGDEHTILVECERGEDAAVAAYRDALEHEELPSELHLCHRTAIHGCASGPASGARFTRSPPKLKKPRSRVIASLAYRYKEEGFSESRPR